MNAVHNNRTTTSWFKSSPYSKETREKADKGKLSSATRTFVKATENPLRIAGTALLATALPLIGIKMLGSSSDDSPLKSWKTLGTVLLGSASAFIVDTAIPEKSNLEEPESSLVSQATPATKIDNNVIVINKAAEDVVKDLFANLFKKGLADGSRFSDFTLNLDSNPWKTLDLDSDINSKDYLETNLKDETSITKKVVINGIEHRIGIRISCADIKEALSNRNNKFRFDILQDNPNTVVGSIITSLADLNFIPPKAKQQLAEEAA